MTKQIPHCAARKGDRGLSACGIEPGTMDSGNRAGVIGDGCDNRRPGRPAIRDIVLGGAVIAVRVKPKRVGAGSVQDASAKEVRSEEHTSELQSLMRISYAVFCLKKKTTPERQQRQ